MRSALNKSSGNGGVVNINAPSDNKVTTSSSQTTSNNATISNPDPFHKIKKEGFFFLIKCLSYLVNGFQIHQQDQFLEPYQMS